MSQLAPSEYVSTGVGTGTELVSNTGDPYTSTDGYSQGDAASLLSVNGGNLRVTNDDAGAAYATVDGITPVVGKDYVAVVEVAGSSGSNARFICGGYNITTLGTGTHILPFTATTTGAATLSNGSNSANTEYVDWGSLSIKEADHGLGRDGVKAFTTHLANTVSSGVVTEATGPAINSSNSQFVVLDGASGTYVSSPDSAAASVTGDITLIAWVAADDYASGAAQNVVGKWNSTGNNLSYLLQVDSSGNLKLFISANGTSSAQAISDAPSFSNIAGYWVRASWDDSEDLTTFYTSEQPLGTSLSDISWTQLGDTKALARGGIYDGTAPVEVGTNGGGANGPFDGKISRAVVINSTDPTAAPVVDYNANDYEAGVTQEASTGEVWTYNGTAKVFSPFARWGDLPGSSGDYFSTPDSAAADVTGGITLVAYSASDDWTSTNQIFISKWLNAGGQKSYAFRVSADGKLHLFATDDGTTTANHDAASTEAVSFTDGTGHWVRVSFSPTANTLDFYTSDDSPWTPYHDITWTQLGTQAAFSSAIASIYSGSSLVNVGTVDAGVGSPFAGKIMRAAVIASTDPTASPSVDFDARAFTPGVSTAVTSTGETWTANGNTSIESNIPAKWDADGPEGYLSEGARTNIQIQSADLTNAEWSLSRATRTANYGIAADGSKTTTLLTSNDAAESSLTGSAKTVTSAADQVVSWDVHESSTGWCHVLVWDSGANGARQWFDVTNGLVGSSTSFGTGFSIEKAWIEPIQRGYRVSVRAANPATTVLQRINLSDGDADVNSAVSATIEVSAPQHESGVQFPSTYIETGASSVTRNADVLTYSAVGNADSFPMTVSVDVTPTVRPGANSRIVSVSKDAADRANLYIAATNQPDVFVKTGGVNQTSGLTSSRKVTAGVSLNMAGVFATNDVESYYDGISGGTDVSASMPDTPVDIGVGIWHDSTGQPYGTIRNLKIFNQRLNDSQIGGL